MQFYKIIWYRGVFFYVIPINEASHWQRLRVIRCHIQIGTVNGAFCDGHGFTCNTGMPSSRIFLGADQPFGCIGVLFTQGNYCPFLAIF